MTSTLDDIVPQEHADALAIRLQDKGPLHRTLAALDDMKAGNYGFSVGYSFSKAGDPADASSLMNAAITMKKGKRKPKTETLYVTVDMAGAFKLFADGQSAMMETTATSANEVANLVNDWLQAVRRTHDLRQFQATWTRSQDAADAQFSMTADKVRAAKPDTRLGKPV